MRGKWRCCLVGYKIWSLELTIRRKSKKKWDIKAVMKINNKKICFEDMIK